MNIVFLLTGLQDAGAINKVLADKIDKQVQSVDEKGILLSFLTFNTSVLKTNFSE